MNYKNWPRKEIVINKLFLDPFSPRIADKFKDATQNEIIQELVKKHGVFKLAKEIVDKKDYPELERYIVIEEDGKFVVLEGNRRLAGYKCLIDPGIAPESEREKFKRLSAQVDFTGEEKLEIFIAPSRQEAIPVLESKHVKFLFEPWSTAMRNKFTRRVKEKSLKPLTGQEKKSIAQANLYEIIKNLELSDKIRDVVNDDKRFKITTFYRIVESSEGKKFLGYTIDDKGNVVPYIDPNEFLKGLKRIVKDVALKNVDSRKLSTTGDIKEYLDKIEKKDRPDLSKILKKPLVGKTQALLKARISPTKKTRLQIDWISSDTYLLYPRQNRIKEILKELKSLKPEDFVNACAVALRVLLELSIYDFLQRKGEIAKMIVSEKRKKAKTHQSLSSDWAPTFKQMLQHLIDGNFIKNPQLKKALSIYINKHSKEPFLAELDQFVHNLYYCPTPTDIKNIWKSFGKPLFEIVSK